MIETLAEIYARHSVEGDCGHGDKGLLHSYIETYERILGQYRQNCSFLEIGLAMGKSMDMWDEYFGPEAKLTGVDISVVFDPTRFKHHPVRIIQADATSSTFLDCIGDDKFDVIIDDGSHMHNDQMASFRMLESRMKTGGIYVIEDILNLEMSGPELIRMHPDCSVVDLRKLKGRFDDVLIVYWF